MATVSGIKVFKDSIKFPSYIFQVVDYTCPDEPKSTSFHSMIISPSLIYSTGIDFSGGAFTTVYESDGGQTLITKQLILERQNRQ